MNAEKSLESENLLKAQEQLKSKKTATKGEPRSSTIWFPGCLTIMLSIASQLISQLVREFNFMERSFTVKFIYGKIIAVTC